MAKARAFALLRSLLVVAVLAACSPPPDETRVTPVPSSTLTPDGYPNRDAVATVRMATVMVSLATPSATAVPDLSSLRDVWVSSINDELGLTFEYPAAYDAEPLKGWGCAIRSAGNTVFFGMDNSVSVTASDGLDLAEYVNRYIQQQGSSFYAWRKGGVAPYGAAEAMIVEYLLRGVNHSGIVVFIPDDDRVYVFRVHLSLACSVPEIDLVSPAPFYRAVRTFKLTR